MAGDWALHTHFDAVPAALKEEGHDALPLAGTREHDERGDSGDAGVSGGAGRPEAARGSTPGAPG